MKNLCTRVNASYTPFCAPGCLLVTKRVYIFYGKCVTPLDALNFQAKMAIESAHERSQTGYELTCAPFKSQKCAHGCICTLLCTLGFRRRTPGCTGFSARFLHPHSPCTHPKTTQQGDSILDPECLWIDISIFNFISSILSALDLAKSGH